MKKQLLLFALTFFISSNTSAQLRSNVDERFELTSIVFRLAGAEEYINDNVPGYAKDIDEYFEQYTDHPLIEYIRFLRNEYEVAYNAVCALAYMLSIDDHSVVITESADIDKLLEDEERWSMETISEFVSLLSDFYRTSRFNEFFKSHSKIYRKAEKEIDRTLRLIDMDWFRDYFGYGAKPQIYVSLVNGPSNYSIPSYIDDDIDFAILIGIIECDSKGNPVSYGDINTLIHELCHFYSNPLTREYESQLYDAAKIILPYVEDLLTEVAYEGVETMLIEGLNNLHTNMYLKQFFPDSYMYHIGRNERYGFIWMEELVNFTEKFYLTRSIFPTIKNFMPEIVSKFNEIGTRINSIDYDFKNSSPRVKEISPNPEQAVECSTNIIKIKFTHHMDTGAYGVRNLIQDGYDYPKIGKLYWENPQTFVIKLKKKLANGCQYGILLPRWNFKTLKNYMPESDIEIIFTTDI